MKISKAEFLRRMTPGTQLTVVRLGVREVCMHRTVREARSHEVVFDTPEAERCYLAVGDGVKIEVSETGYVLSRVSNGDAIEYKHGHVGEDVPIRRRGDGSARQKMSSARRATLKNLRRRRVLSIRHVPCGGLCFVDDPDEDFKTVATARTFEKAVLLVECRR